MKNLVFILCAIFALSSHAQDVKERVLYVVDSVPVIDDPKEEEATLLEEDIESLTIVTNNAEMEKYGYAGYDKLAIIFTKEYAKRPLEIKKIPTLNHMIRTDGKWYLKEATTAYSGPFIDYYYNGKIQGEGFLEEGVVHGIRTIFYANGNKKFVRTYKKGILHGETLDYLKEGQLSQKGSFKDGKKHGLWQDWYSTGELKRQNEFKEGEVLWTDNDKKVNSIFEKAMKMVNEYNYQGAVKGLSKAIELDTTLSDLYFHRGTAYLNAFKFDEAIKDYDKAIALEPLYMESYVNRAFARLRKHEFRDSRTLTKNSEVTILASKDVVTMPAEELSSICTDLNKGISLGDKSAMTLDAKERYCK